MPCVTRNHFYQAWGGERERGENKERERERQRRQEKGEGGVSGREKEGEGILGKDVKHLNNINLKYANVTYNARHSRIVLCLWACSLMAPGRNNTSERWWREYFYNRTQISSYKMNVDADPLSHEFHHVTPSIPFIWFSRECQSFILYCGESTLTPDISYDRGTRNESDRLCFSMLDKNNKSHTLSLTYFLSLVGFSQGQITRCPFYINTHATDCNNTEHTPRSTI